MRSEKSFKFFNPRTWGGAYEGLKFLAVALLAFYVPLLMYHSTTGQSIQFYVMFVNEAVGGLLGLLMYNLPSAPAPSCVPADVRPAEARPARSAEAKKAA